MLVYLLLQLVKGLRFVCFCFKYFEYLVHGQRLIIKKITFYLKRLCFVSLPLSFLSQLTENISVNTTLCNSDTRVLFFCDRNGDSIWNHDICWFLCIWNEKYSSQPTHTYAVICGGNVLFDTDFHKSNFRTDFEPNHYFHINQSFWIFLE